MTPMSVQARHDRPRGEEDQEVVTPNPFAAVSDLPNDYLSTITRWLSVSPPTRSRQK